MATIFTASIPPKGEKPVREQTRYVGGLEYAETFYKRLYVEALKQGVDETGEVVVIGDGAAWIWNQAELTLPKNRVEIIDYYHASEKLWTVARAVWGKEDAQGKQWVEGWSDRLHKGRFDNVLAALKRLRGQTAAARESIRQTIGYFTTNRKRMRFGRWETPGRLIPPNQPRFGAMSLDAIEQDVPSGCSEVTFPTIGSHEVGDVFMIHLGTYGTHVLTRPR